MWSVSDAKAQLSEILRQARSGHPQFIGSQDPCVVVSLETYRSKIADSVHDGQWLVEHAARVRGEIELPPRADDRGDDAFGG